MRAWIAVVGAIGAVCVEACSGDAPPPPPPPPTPTETTQAPPPTTAETPAPVVDEVAPPIAPTIAAPRVPRTLAMAYSGGCAIHEGRVSCWGESPREDDDEEISERAEVQLTGDFVDLAGSDTIACATRPITAPPPTTTTSAPPASVTPTPSPLPPAHDTVCFGTGDDIADDVREREEEDRDDDDWDGDEEEIATIDLASSFLRRAIDLSVGEAGGCVVQPAGASDTIVHCGGDSFEARALDGVRGTEGILEVCVGSQFACGRTRDGHARCWGDNEFGQLGDGLESGTAESATEVRGLDRVLHLACGADHACALRDDHTVWCWGDNDYGQLGRDPALELSRTPLRVESIEAATSIALGSGVSCALFDEGPPRCWGDGDMGRLGDGTTRSSFTPVAATAVGPVRELAFGELHACAVRGDDASSEVVCWGLGGAGAIGPRARRREYGPVEMFAGIAGITRLEIGGSSICALVGGDASAPDVRCAGRLGAPENEGVEGARAIHAVPQTEIAASPTLARLVNAERATETVYSSLFLCTLAGSAPESGGHLVCTSRTTQGAVGATLDDVAAVIAATSRVCILRSSGVVECAAETAASTALSFAALPHLPLASALVAIAGTPCVVTRDDASLVCEGRTYGTQRGVEPYPAPSNEPSEEDAGPSTTPAMYRYRELTGITALVTGGGVTARLADGRLVRVTQSAAPTQILDGALSIAEGTSFACARRRGEQGVEVWCWGSSPRGQLARSEASSAPIRIAGLEVPLPARAEGEPPIDLATHGVTELVVRDGNACARLSDGRILCWGADEDGQLARAPGTLRLRPVVVLD